MTGQFASSRAGHDKGKIYVIVREENSFVFLSDGRVRTLEHPKKKRRKHVQLINYFLASECMQRIETGQVIHNEEIQSAIQQYNKLKSI